MSSPSEPSEEFAAAPNAAAMEEGEPREGLARPLPPPNEIPPLPIFSTMREREKAVVRVNRGGGETRDAAQVAGQGRGWGRGKACTPHMRVSV